MNESLDVARRRVPLPIAHAARPDGQALGVGAAGDGVTATNQSTVSVPHS